MWYLYIILCQDDSLYTGISPDPKKRFELHKQGKASKYTRAHPPTKIVYTESFPTRSEASKREYEIKSWTRQQKIQILKLQP